ncbi:LamG-like jellyroll fold domain-containing protein [Streptomyces yaizuensis]|uniref:LamG domain-containing protein n=1 Tax=Streptomyces yaizuensis TaxID=2989713 RepID=A0ABQ5P737_9ACTN|nr:LamG-like jellyroll fold domain-containing protein [Streptomyces sp. YSPA8]GLF98364.1 LamG domain-containing protein [Streptomyces sp. YSPA8]
MRRAALVTAALALLLPPLVPGSAVAGPPARPGAVPDGGVGRHLVAFYDFAHPVPGDPGRERDLGRSGTALRLVNGGELMRVRDPVRGRVLETRQVTPAERGNDDWKAGVYDPAGVASLRAFNGAREATVMGWFKPVGELPAPNSQSADPTDHYGAVGLAGILSGTSQGHDVRALLELIKVDGVLRLVALGRRADGAGSQTFAADADWRQLLPHGRWVHLAATFDFDTGAMALYRDGRPLTGSLVVPGDPWALAGPPEPDTASPSDPRGIKIGGSYPQNTREGNPCSCRMDDLAFLDRALSPAEVRARYRSTR